MNVPKAIGMLVGRGLAKLHELDTVYGTEDMWDLIEIATVDDYNRALMQKAE